MAVDSSVEGRHPGIDVSEPNTPEAAAAGGLGTPSAAQTNDDTQDQTGLELVLRPPDDAVVISLQSVVRGVLTRYRYRALKVRSGNEPAKREGNKQERLNMISSWGASNSLSPLCHVATR